MHALTTRAARPIARAVAFALLGFAAPAAIPAPESPAASRETAGPALVLQITTELGTAPRASPPGAASVEQERPRLRLIRAEELGPRATQVEPPPPAAVAAPEKLSNIIVAITLNSEPKGEFFVLATPDGDYLVKASDLAAMGVKDPRGRTVAVEGEVHVSLRSVEGAQLKFDPKTITLEITLSPALLPKKVFDLQPTQENVIRPRDNSAFLNYRLGYAGASTSATNPFSLTTELGARHGDFLFRNEHLYRKAASETSAVRLFTQLIHDDRDDSRRLIVGDTFAFSGDLGAPVNIGGISYSKLYQISPYFIRYPTLNFTGVVPLPSEVEVTVAGMPVLRQRVSPGAFELQNFTYYGGSRNVEVVIKDPFGRREVLSYPFYFTDQVLAAGLHEYSYNLGMLREDFGLSSNRYGGGALSAFHRYGVSNHLTVGLRGEAVAGKGNVGPLALYRSDRLGLFSGSVALSRNHASGRDGQAASFGYDYQSGDLGGRLLVRRFSDAYTTIQPVLPAQGVRSERLAGVTYGRPHLGTVVLDYASADRFQGDDLRATTYGYSRTLFGRLSLSFSYRRVTERNRGHEVFLSALFVPKPELNASYFRRRSAEGATLDVVQVAKSVPAGEGFGYRVSYETEGGSASHGTVLAPFVQYNSRYATYTAEMRAGLGGTQDSRIYQLAAAGALIYVGGEFGLTRPVFDSFAIARITPPLEGVRVYQNDQEIGRTDAKGALLIPNIGSFHNNQISINDKDIPIDYAIGEVRRVISPPFRSGSLVDFAVTRIQGITGKIRLRIRGQLQAAEHYEVVLIVEGKKIEFPTGKDGEFYLENLKPGSHPGALTHRGQVCRFELRIPDLPDTIVDLKEIVACDLEK